MKKLTAISAAALATLALAASASAHPNHRSCKVFGNATAAFVQTLPPGGFGAIVSASAPANDDIAFFHTIECEPG